MSDSALIPSPISHLVSACPSAGCHGDVMARHCLLEPGGAYAFYAPGAGIAVNLRGRGAASPAEWIDTWTGARQPAGMLEPGLLKLQQPKSFGDAPAVLIVR